MAAAAAAQEHTMNKTLRSPASPSHPMDRVTGVLAAGSLACLVILQGCGPQDGSAVNTAQTRSAPAPVPAARPAPAPTLGSVSHIETLTERPQGSGVGAVAGGVVGGVLGHQVGDGDGQKVATAAGAIGGALLGHKIERDRKERVVGYNVRVTLDSGETRTFRRDSLNGLTVGSRVRLQNGGIQPA
jgi:outer membrane lipoprotein SlyB